MAKVSRCFRGGVSGKEDLVAAQHVHVNFFFSILALLDFPSRDSYDRYRTFDHSPNVVNPFHDRSRLYYI
ncbi:hypothetical protein LMH87_005140 [Akanthomyces muscarius]|uniref:Uncharacterized protein n=1 Tax=Akanthomyces muscarius TaxID=2231603 RepID=A0A9W8UQA6_AKAMU|nr:hypothetical protein LMH87_005140 [Akanthomyces muscarius]KAJ4163406.1 hypothetical protein LMH87_005140 [Akanthomyces muscarius]